MDNLNRMLTCGKREMGRLDFESALEMLNEGIDYAKLNKIDQTQDLRNAWAKLHEMKSLCYCHQVCYTNQIQYNAILAPRIHIGSVPPL